MLPKENFGITVFSIIPDSGVQLKKSNDIYHMGIVRKSKNRDLEHNK